MKKINTLMKFENKNVEVIELKGKVLFNPRHVGDCLGIDNVTVRRHLQEFTEKHVIKVINSDVQNMNIRNLNNAGENFLTESGVYKLIFKSKKEEALKFQDWVTDEVLPQIRKTGSFNAEFKGEEKMFQLMRADISGLLDEMVAIKIKEIETKCSDYYRPSSFDKTNICSYIKKRLGILKANDEYDLVKQRVLLKLGATKWEDVPVEELRKSLNIIDESIRIIKLDRPIEQLSLFA